MRGKGKIGKRERREERRKEERRGEEPLTSLSVRMALRTGNSVPDRQTDEGQ